MRRIGSAIRSMFRIGTREERADRRHQRNALDARIKAEYLSASADPMGMGRVDPDRRR
jgi:hypothetical protein